MAEIKRLKHKRAQLKGSLTRVRNAVERCDVNEESDLTELKERLTKISEIWDGFMEVQEQIEERMINNPEDLDENTLEADGMEQREMFENLYYETLAVARRKMSTNKETPVDNTLMSSGATSTQVNIKLPVLTLPEFDGQYSKWMLFKDSFMSAVDSNQSITDIQRFQYLRSALKNEALQVVESLETSGHNYKVAWDLLSAQYENRRIIVNTHLKEIIDMPAITKDNKVPLGQFINHIRKHVRALEALKLPVKQWDTILIYMATSKLDFYTRKEWETHIGTRSIDTLPTLEELLKFLSDKSHMLEMIEQDRNRTDVRKPVSNANKKFDKRERVTLASTVPTTTCELCKDTHNLYFCSKFLKLPISARIQEVKNLHLCMNCLRRGHRSKECRSSGCKQCGKRHNSLLHLKQEDVPNSAATANNEEHVSATIPTVCTKLVKTHASQVLLSTIQVDIPDNNGRLHQCRALLDPGSQSNIITGHLAKSLKLPVKSINLPIIGINHCKTNINQSTEFNVKSRYDNSNFHIECLILPTITGTIPQTRIDTTQLNIPKRVQLADERYHEPGTVDLLLGAGIFWQVLKSERINLAPNLPVLQHTKFGWILGGEIGNHQTSTISCNLLLNTELDHLLERFWKVEEVQSKTSLSKEEEFCERYYAETVSQNPDGRIIVRLPKRANVKLGDSYEVAHKRLISLENRFKKQPTLKNDYINFMNDYEHLGHMSITKGKDDNSSIEKYYLPHHPILRTDHITTRLRVVFDGSATSDSGASLNDKLIAGPTIQDNLLDIILRFRLHQFALTADIVMMYRQILVSEEDRDLQQILWRSNSDQPIKIFRLNTITYGTSCAPYLATRSLKELASRYEADYPQAAMVLKNDFYVDDLLTGTNELKEAINLQKQLDDLLQRGQFKLRKWTTNDSRILSHLEKENESDDLLILNRHEAIKTLGLLWNSTTDTLQYSVSTKLDQKITKRTILSQISKIFDPLGLIGPVLIIAKLIMQDIWKQQLEWDAPVPHLLFNHWNHYCNSLEDINYLRVPRNVNPHNANSRIILHGFSDASERAYGACIYVSSTNENQIVTTQLMCSKSKVSPLKSISIPRLELCAALLLARLLSLVMRALRSTIEHTYLWTDSTIVLAWLRTRPHQLKTFVSNRVAEIQQLTEEATWRHVSSKDNPADLLSRGIPTKELKDSELWWYGPNWLDKHEQWPKEQPIASQQLKDLELKPTITMTITQNPNFIFEKFSSFSKLTRIVAYCFKFANKCKGKRESSILTLTEVKHARTRIIRLTQEQTFSQEFRCLVKNSPLHCKSKLLTLKPFLDDQGLLRVGGRLQNSNLAFNQRHPIVLPSRHHITTLMLRDEHKHLLHCGPEHLLSNIRQNYWPLSGRREARKITTKCVTCFRARPKPLEATMANLPHARVEGFIKPFATSGVDFAGPLQIREGRRRGRIPITKGYIAVFVCFNTRAVHLELVGDLTTESFLASLKRFIARRGMCSNLYSDNGTNFVGANRELRELHDFLQKNKSQLTTQLTKQNLTWHFIPPRSPNFGGLWEAAVKCAKRHLYTVARNLIMTFEECYTLLTEIESVLNSRPLIPLSSNPNDLVALTPSHFLLGDSPTEPVQQDLSHIPDNHLSRWQHGQKVRQHFWKRWQREYLHQLQTRTKWCRDTAQLKIGTIVLISEDNIAPLHWPLGRVLEIHPGQDGVARVATIKTSTGNYQRPVRKLCALPMDTDNIQ